MTFLEWSKSSVNYGRKLVNSAVEGARIGEDNFSREEASVPCLGKAAQRAVCPAVVGICLGALSGYLSDERRSASRTLVCGFLGGLIGFGAGVLWDSRHFTASVATSTWKNIGKTRDEHWFERNPIDYA
ncbi:MAG: hypothetical protein ACLQLC_19610 [Candidatus Sulfotelmatobacter sp.]